MSKASHLQTMVGELREDLQRLIALDTSSNASETVKRHLVDIVDLAGRSTAVTKAADHLEDAVVRVTRMQQDGHHAGFATGSDQSSLAVNMIENPLAELASAVHKLP